MTDDKKKLKEKLTFPFIVLEHLKRIIELGSKEWKGGYWETTEKNMGGFSYTEKKYVPDSLSEYSNAVEQMANILAPFFDTEMIKEEKKIVDEKEKKLKTEEKIELFNYYFRKLNEFLNRKKYFKDLKIDG